MHHMKDCNRFHWRLWPFLVLVALLLHFPCVGAEGINWIETNDTIACEAKGKILWRFSYSTNESKPFFHPLSVLGDESLTENKSKDQPWQYGLWFSWKYVNGVSYQEGKKTNSKAHGFTRWNPPEITKRDNGMATIRMKLEYLSPANEVIMTERREIFVSVPDRVGEVLMDWNTVFSAESNPVVLAETLDPAEIEVNSSCAGIALRVPSSPAKCEFLTIEGPVDEFKAGRAQRSSRAMACNVIRGDLKSGVGVFSCAANAPRPTPWEVSNSSSLRLFSSVLLAPGPRKLKPHESFPLKFRITTKAGGWTAQDLQVADKNYEEYLALLEGR
jgi:hypothetical protein